MGFLLAIAAVLVVLLVIAYLMDRRSRRIRGRVPTVRSRGGMFSANADARTKLRMSEAIGGRHQVRNMGDPPDPTDPAR